MTVNTPALKALPSAQDSIETGRLVAASLRPFFEPRSVAVIGASDKSSSIACRIFTSLLNGFRGTVYPVNPSHPELCSLRSYPSVFELPSPPDLAIIAVAAEKVPDIVEECGKSGVRAVVVISAGFAETGPEGAALQERIVNHAKNYRMRLIGPNCLGLLNTDPKIKLNATFSPVYPPAGRIALSSQSGALGIALLALAEKRQIGLSTFVSVGNKADVSGNDLLQYWEEDPNTGVILLYLESFGNPRRFARIARRTSRKKPVVAVKSGKTKGGERAAGSHTAGLAANDVLVDALFSQSGVIRAETVEEMFDIAEAIEHQPLPNGNRVAILTNGGGPGVICADACEAGGLGLADLSPATKEKLRSFLPKAAALADPVDMLASANALQYGKAIEAILADKNIDSLIVIYTPVAEGDLNEIVAAIRNGISNGRALGGKDKAVYACLMIPTPGLPPLEAGKERIPVYAFPEVAAKALAKVMQYAAWKKKPVGVIPELVNLDMENARSVCRESLEKHGAGWLSGNETRQVLRSAGLPVLKGGVASSPDEAVKIATEIGFPVAVKLSSRTITHKTEMGGVILNLNDEKAVRDAFLKIKTRLAAERMENAMEGVLVQPMVSHGVELMGGVTLDPLFGPLVAFGLGGIHVEILNDVQFRITPLTDRDAVEMVESIHGYRLLEGYRGHPPADINAIHDLLLRLSHLAQGVPEITELDLNPVIALPPGQGCRIVDARIKVDHPKFALIAKQVNEKPSGGWQL